MTQHVIIVTGSREWTDWRGLHQVLANACPDLIVQGGCPAGADDMARLWAMLNGVMSKTFHANWKKLGRRAGPERNTRMLMAYPRAIVVAFPLGGPGTRHCIAEAQRLGMKVHVYGEGGRLLGS